jgi:hypothetical protein
LPRRSTEEGWLSPFGPGLAAGLLSLSVVTVGF